MKIRIVTFLALFALAYVAFGQSSALTINTSTGLINIPSGSAVPNFTSLKIGGVSLSYGANMGNFLATPSSANLRAAMTDESGSGALVFAGGNIGAATATSVNGLTLTSSTGSLTIANGKTLTVSNTVTLAGTDGSTLDVGAGGTLGTGAFSPISTYGAWKSATLNMYASGGGSAYIDGNFHDDPDLQIASLPAGTYAVELMILAAMDNTNTGFKWQLAGSATYTGSTRFQRNWTVVTPAMSVLTSGFKNGDSTTFFNSDNFVLRYEGIIVVTVAGSFKLQIGTPSAGDSGQFLEGSFISLKKIQ